MSGIAGIDRRVQVVAGTGDQETSIHRVSDLREWPFVVVLGEPGVGKSTVFGAEAAQAGAPVIKVRDLMTGSDPESGDTLFLDALDEYRVEGMAADKIHHLAKSITAANVSRWRLSCRSEDWRKEADIAAIQRTTKGQPILVVQLLPLDDDEAMAVLSALGEPDPQGFIAKAHSFGATAFIENPLSLKLLHRAVADGASWPASRYELFDSAVRRLAHDKNPEYKLARQSSPDEILTAAGKACLALLATGARSIWRSGDEPPASKDDIRAHVTAHALEMDRVLTGDVLDTALFRGEGEAFEPVHRTVAEYLAGRTLAHAVLGTTTTAALPLARAISLITAADNRAPSELRGLYAWFAAHLAKLGDEIGALRLVEADAVTVLAYGDAAVFSTPLRRAILHSLGRDDPYFRASEVGISAVGGLAGEDLADDFADILEDSSENSHRLLTVFDALTNGPPVHSLRPKLRAISLDSTRPEWQRWRAADAWLNGSPDPMADRRLIFDELSSEPISTARETLRARLLAALPRASISVADVRSVISDYQASPEDNTVARLYRLQQCLEAEPMPELFEQPLKTWLGPKEQRKHEIDIQHMLDYALAALISSRKDLDAAQLLRWLSNAYGDIWSGVSEEVGRAIKAWIDQHADREIELFDCILEGDDLNDGPWVVGNDYSAVAQRSPSAAVIRHVLYRAKNCEDKVASRRLLEIVGAIASRPSADIDAYWEVHEFVSEQDDCSDLLSKISVTTIPKWKQIDAVRAERESRELAEHRAKNIQTMTPRIQEIRSGALPPLLSWAAQRYFRPEQRGPEKVLPRIQNVVALTNSSIAEAFAQGWKHVVTVCSGVDSSELGRAEALGRSREVEWSALAGVDLLLASGRLADVRAAPLSVAVIALKSSWYIREDERREQVERWALSRLEQDPAKGAADVHAFWAASIDAGASRLSLLSLAEEGQAMEFFRQAIDALLTSHPSMPEEMLRAALSLAAKRLTPERMKVLAELALASPTVQGEPRRLWHLLSFALDPAAFGDQFFDDYKGTEVPELFVEISDGLAHTLDILGEATRTLRETMTIRLLGRLGGPDLDRRDGEWTREMARTEAVRRAINWLSNQADSDAAVAISRLIQEDGLEAWRPSLQHARANQARLQRDSEFRHPSVPALLHAMSGGPPVNARDLQAVVTEELRRLQAELHTGDNTPWKLFWNLDSSGKPTIPLVENECRNRLLDRLRDRLKPYGIAAALPEARRGEDTRADMLVLSATGQNLPVEAKRHFHVDIWEAASTQLQGYAADLQAEGFGVYLVFWFGNNVAPTPGRPDGREGPTTAAELEDMLRSDLSPELRSRTEIVVFDVSDPKSDPTVKARKKRVSKSD